MKVALAIVIVFLAGCVITPPRAAIPCERPQVVVVLCMFASCTVPAPPKVKACTQESET